MKTIFHVCVVDDEIGEAEGMFNEAGELLGTWALNDAMWRNEYMDGFMRKMGIEVKGSDDPKLVQKIKEVWSY